MAKKTYYVATIRGDYRDSILLFSTEKKAKEYAYNYALMWWKNVMGEDTPVPMDPEEVMSKYFLRAEETYKIYPRQLEG